MSREHIRQIAGQPRKMFGWQKDRPDNRDVPFQTSLFKALTLPRRADLRANCSRVENQGDIGSCTANSSTSAIEFLYRKIKLQQPELSRLFLYFATRVWIAGEPPTNDNGAMIRDVMKALAKFGVCLETAWPYDLKKWQLEPPADAKTNAQNHQILKYYRCPSLRYIRACIAEGYPTVGGFSVPQSIDSDETTETGKVAYPKTGEDFVGGHAVLFVGYDDSTKLLTFQNSWGTDWGDKGFGYLPYDYVTNYLANDFWTIRLAEL